MTLPDLGIIINDTCCSELTYCTAIAALFCYRTLNNGKARICTQVTIYHTVVLLHLYCLPSRYLLRTAGTISLVRCILNFVHPISIFPTPIHKQTTYSINHCEMTMVIHRNPIASLPTFDCQALPPPFRRYCWVVQATRGWEGRGRRVNTAR